MICPFTFCTGNPGFVASLFGGTSPLQAISVCVLSEGHSARKIRGREQVLGGKVREHFRKIQGRGLAFTEILDCVWFAILQPKRTFVA
jgi:hypothetical protein